MNKEEKYNELAIEVIDELESINQMLEDVVNECIKLTSRTSVIASITFKVPAYIYPNDKDFKELREKLNKLRELSKELDLAEFNSEVQLENIDLALNALDTLEKSYDEEFDTYNKIEDLRYGLDLDIEVDL